MKSRFSSHVTKAALIAAAVLAVCFSAVTANAQSSYRGEFTLPYEVQWGRAVLPAGDYLFTFTLNDIPPVVVVRDAQTFRTVAFERVDIQARTAEGGSALLIGRRGKERVIYSLRIAALGKIFVYDPELARAHTIEEAHQAQAIPVVLAKK